MKYKQSVSYQETRGEGGGCRFHLGSDEVQQVVADDSADIRQEVS